MDVSYSIAELVRGRRDWGKCGDADSRALRPRNWKKIKSTRVMVTSLQATRHPRTKQENSVRQLPGSQQWYWWEPCKTKKGCLEGESNSHLRITQAMLGHFDDRYETFVLAVILSRRVMKVSSAKENHDPTEKAACAFVPLVHCFYVYPASQSLHTRTISLSHSRYG